MAPPKRGPGIDRHQNEEVVAAMQDASKTGQSFTPMVSNPLHNDDTRSFPARAATIELCAPETQGPWSAQSIIQLRFPAVGATSLTGVWYAANSDA